MDTHTRVSYLSTEEGRRCSILDFATPQFDFILREREDKDQMVTGGDGLWRVHGRGGRRALAHLLRYAGPPAHNAAPRRFPSGAASRPGLSGSVAGMHEHDSTGPRELGAS